MESGLVEKVLGQAALDPDKVVMNWVGEVEGITSSLTYGQIARGTAAIDSYIKRFLNCSLGDRVVLVFPPGLDFFVAFLACLRAGVVAVPVYPPNLAGRAVEEIAKFNKIVEDSGAVAVLTNKEYMWARRIHKASNLTKFKLKKGNGPFYQLKWASINDAKPVKEGDMAAFRCHPVDKDALAFLQYTSGSTGTPKGVMLTHGHLGKNVHIASRLVLWKGVVPIVCVSWLPQYHDMGLQSALCPLAYGGTTYLTSPFTFIKKPMIWLQMISAFQATVTQAPNFAYELVSRKFKTKDAGLGFPLNLSTVQNALCGAEPIRTPTMEKFLSLTAEYGFNPRSLTPAYGLAETVVFVCSRLENNGLQVSQGRVGCGRVNASCDANGNHAAFSSTGERVFLEETGIVVRIVDPETRAVVSDGIEGEVWVSSPSNGLGYWGRPELSEYTFHARLSFSPTGEDLAKTWLRTGDIGFLENCQLYICTRMKDLIIINGRNYAPQDIEVAVEKTRGIRPGCVAAFSVDSKDGGSESAGVVAELTADISQDQCPAIVENISQEVRRYSGVVLASITLLRTRSIPKTTSGKIRRQACKDGVLMRTLNEVFHYEEGSVLLDLPQDNLLPKASVLGRHVDETINEGQDTDIAQVLIEAVSSLLGVSMSKISVESPLMDLGISSVQAVELSEMIQERYCVDVPSTVVFDFPTITEIARYLRARLDGIDPLEGLRADADNTIGDDQIAIVGVGARFPNGVESVEGFWQELCEAGLKLTRPPLERGNDFVQMAPGGGYMKELHKFDPSFFGISRAEAACMDPQQRVAMETAWMCLRDSGLEDPAFVEKSCGVFIGVSGHDHERAKGTNESGSVFFAQGSASAIVANRISYWLGLVGPSVVVDTACSSSLAAVHTACSALNNGECRMAMAGGVNAILLNETTEHLKNLGVIANDDRCRVFEDGSGYVRSEGCGIILLKRLKDAVNDGDFIYGTISTSLQHVGRTASLTAPSTKSQIRLMKDALNRAKASARDVSFVEGHLTGTTLGDKMEFDALKFVYGSKTNDVGPVFVGASKAMYGHAESASGILGLIKTALITSYRCIPPNPSLSRPVLEKYSNMTFKSDELHSTRQDGPMVYPAGCPAEPLLVAEESLVTSVNSFGFGGTIGCAVLKEFVPSDYLGSQTIAVPMVFAGQGSDQLGKVASACYQQLPLFSEGFDACSRALQTICKDNSSIPYFDLMSYVTMHEGSLHESPSSALHQQLLIVAVEVGLLSAWRARGITPSIVLGHSLGEYVAAFAAGVFDLSTLISIVCIRGKLLEDLPKKKRGAMVAVQMSDVALTSKIRELSLQSKLTVGLVNGANRVVASGESSAVSILVDSLGPANCRVLNTGFAFHSPTLDATADAFHTALRNVRMNSPDIPFVSGVTGGLVDEKTLCKPKYWRDHLCQRIQFSTAALRMYHLVSESPKWIEVGPDDVLSRIIMSGLDGRVFVASSLCKGEYLFPTVRLRDAERYVRGCPQKLSLSSVFNHRQEFSLKMSTFSKVSDRANPIHFYKKVWKEITPGDVRAYEKKLHVVVLAGIKSKEDAAIAEAMVASCVNSAAAVTILCDSKPCFSVASGAHVCVSGPRAWATHIHSRCKETGLELQGVIFIHNTESHLEGPVWLLSHVKELFAVSERTSSPMPHVVVYTGWTVDALLRSADVTCGGYLGATRVMATEFPATKPICVTVSSKSPPGVWNDSQRNMFQARFESLLKGSLDGEQACLIDPDGVIHGLRMCKDDSLESRITSVSAEEKEAEETKEIQQDDVYVVIGGSGAIGLGICEALARRPGISSVVAWARTEFDCMNEKAKKRIEASAEINGMGLFCLSMKDRFKLRTISPKRGQRTMFYISCPLEDKAAVYKMVKAIVVHLGKFKLGGIIHAGGTLENVPILQQEEDGIHAEMGAKPGSLMNLIGAFTQFLPKESPPAKAILALSSIAVTLGSPGQYNYASTNSCFAQIMHSNTAREFAKRRLVYELPPVHFEDESGMAYQDGNATKKAMERWGVGGLHGEEVVALIEKQLFGGSPSTLSIVTAARQDWSLYAHAQPNRLNMLSELVTESISYNSLENTSTKGDICAQLAGVTSKICGREITEGDIGNLTFMEMGLDSLAMMELRAVVLKRYEVSVPTMLHQQYSTIDALAEYICERKGMHSRKTECADADEGTGSLLAEIKRLEKEAGTAALTTTIPHDFVRRMSSRALLVYLTRFLKLHTTQRPGDKLRLKALSEQAICESSSSSSTSSASGCDDGHISRMSVPLSIAQEQMLVLHESNPESSAYNEVAALQLNGPVHIPTLRKAIVSLSGSHTTLKSRFFRDRRTGEFTGLVTEPNESEDGARLLHLQPLEKGMSTAEIFPKIENWASMPFALHDGPPLRFLLVCSIIQKDDGEWTSGGESFFVASMHHIIVDGISVAKCMGDLMSHYNYSLSNDKASMPAPVITQYPHFAIWQRVMHESGEWEEDLRKWMGILGVHFSGRDAGLTPEDVEFFDDLPILALPSDYSRGTNTTGVPVCAETIRVDKSLADTVRSLAASNGCTMFTVLLAWYYTCLLGWSGEREVIIGTPFNARPDGMEDIVGYAVNTLPLRIKTEHDHPNFISVLEVTKQVCSEALALGQVPFQYIVDTYRRLTGAACDPTTIPIYQTMFAVLPAWHKASDGDMQGVGIKPMRIRPGGCKFEIMMDVYDNEDGSLDCHLECSSTVFHSRTIGSLARFCTHMLECLVSDPLSSVVRHPMMSPQDERRLIQHGDKTQVYSPFADLVRSEKKAGANTTTLHGLFERQASRTPSRVALVTRERTLTYRELNGASDAIAKALDKLFLGEPTQEVVGLCLERGTGSIPAVFGVLKSGAAYVPLDYRVPSTRLRNILTDCGSRIVLYSRLSLNHDNLKCLIENSDLTSLCVEDIFEGLDLTSSSSKPCSRYDGSLAYVLSTSGSTGNPNNVALSHSAVICEIAWMVDTFVLNHFNDSSKISKNKHMPRSKLEQLSSSMSYLQSTTLSFDNSVVEIFTALVCGGRIAMAQPGSLADADVIFDDIERFAVTHVSVVPSVLSSWLASTSRRLPSSLLHVLAGGEALKPALVCDFYSRTSNRNTLLHNTYGPTETAVDATAAVIPRTHETSTDPTKAMGTPIGNAITFRRVLVMREAPDGSLSMVPSGASGELFIGGPALADGYLNNPQKTSERFITDKLHGRLFRTGDHVRWAPDGQLVFIGRKDHQVKIRGMRIELGDIESVVSSSPGVSEAAVVFMKKGDRSGNHTWRSDTVVAYVTPTSVSTQVLNDHCSKTLPHHMRPLVITMDSWPRTVSGKIDRKRLPGPASNVETGESTPRFILPRGPIESAVYNIWRAAMDLSDDVRLCVETSNYFSVGGTSLLAGIVAGKIRQKFGIGMPIVTVFSHPTISEMADYISANMENNIGSISPAAAGVEEHVSSPIASNRSPAVKDILFTDAADGGGVVDSYPIRQLGTSLSKGKCTMSNGNLKQPSESRPRSSGRAVDLYFMLLKALGIIVCDGLVALSALPAAFAAICMLEQNGGTLCMLALPFFVLTTIIMYMGIALAVKWTLIHQSRPSKNIPMDSHYQVRWRIVSTVLKRLNPLLIFFKETPVLVTWYRLLGARIGDRVVLGSLLETPCLDCVCIGNHVIIQPDVSIQPEEFTASPYHDGVSPGVMSIGNVSIEDGAIIGIAADIVGGGKVSRGAHVPANSSHTRQVPLSVAKNPILVPFVEQNPGNFCKQILFNMYILWIHFVSIIPTILPVLAVVGVQNVRDYILSSSPVVYALLGCVYFASLPVLFPWLSCLLYYFHIAGTCWLLHRLEGRGLVSLWMADWFRRNMFSSPMFSSLALINTGTPFLRMIYRGLGATVGEGAYLAPFSCSNYRGVHIGKNACFTSAVSIVPVLLTPVVTGDNGIVSPEMYVAKMCPVFVGKDSAVFTKSYLYGGTSVGDGAQVADMSVCAPNTEVPVMTTAGGHFAQPWFLNEISSDLEIHAENMGTELLSHTTSPSLLKQWGVAFIQYATLPVILFPGFCSVSVVQTLAWCLVPYMLNGELFTSVPLISRILFAAVMYPLCALLYSSSLCVVCVLMKHTIGKHREGRFLLWGSNFIRWHIMGFVCGVNHHYTETWRGTGWFNLWLRAMGAKVGRRSTILSESQLCDANLLSVGDGAMIGPHSFLVMHGLSGGHMTFAPIKISKAVTVGYGCVLARNVVCEENVMVRAGSYLMPSEVVHATDKNGMRVVWEGKPASPVTDSRTVKAYSYG